ncbi:MAG: amidophosphoribosyltransferase [Legionella sp.]|nr:MAG: amidophosphoribosyltransferase [Legionella sp.]PJD98496.1 MAG: amidophosphoribosyltransferase [Legionella sp.]
MRHKLSSIAQKMHLPTLCVLCRQFHKDNMAVCKDCIAFFPTLTHGCSLCAYPLPQSHHPICGHCIKNPPWFNQTITMYPFIEPLRGLLHRFKYKNGLYLSSFFGQLILNGWQKRQTPLPQCFIPVPMHPKKIRTRGFNQTVLLARFLSRQLHIPYYLDLCQKTIHTQPQMELDKRKRASNMQQAFRVNPQHHTHIALIDDLLTTGNTANQLAKQFKQAGAQTVEVWCSARAINS